jgi:pyridoxal phosphate enzyme (YggS family)
VTGDARLDELAANLRSLEERVAAACRAAGRDPAEVTLVAISKTWPAADVLRLHALGVRDFGENRDQEAKSKAAALSAAGAAVRWHFVGRLQRNKCASVARYADVVHAVDRADLVEALSGGAVRAGRTLDALVQLSIDGDPRRGGAVDAELPELADRVAAAPGLRLAGVMAIAPQAADPAVAFATLADVAARVRRTHPEATTLSAGMTADLEQAIAHGSTCVRVGTALFGGRAALLR